MNARAQSSVAAALTVAVGMWMLLIPVFASVTGGALVTVLAIGSVVALLGVAELFWKDMQTSWLAGIAAIWLLISSFGFRLDTVVAWNMALAALATLVLATWDGVEVGRLMRSPQAQHRHT